MDSQLDKSLQSIKTKICNITNNKIQKIKSYENNNFIVTKMIEDLINIFKLTGTGLIKIKNKEYIIKKEYFKDQYSILKFIYNLVDLDVNEYKFYKKYQEKIIKSGFNKNIQLPIQYRMCKKAYFYLFKKIDFDLNKNFLEKINKCDFFNIVSQIIFVTYYLNHKLNIFHNDLFLINNLRNIMINKNKTPYFLKIDNYKIKVQKYCVIFIDFGLYNKRFRFKNKDFYYKQNIKYFTIFKIKSELLAILYLAIRNYSVNNKISFKKLYDYFYNQIKIKNLKNFDKCILNSVNQLENIINTLKD